MHDILEIRKINPLTAIVVVGEDEEETGQMIICSDYKIQVNRVKKSKKDVTVKVTGRELKKEKISDIVKINVCPSSKKAIRFKSEIVNAQTLKIIIES